MPPPVAVRSMRPGRGSAELVAASCCGVFSRALPQIGTVLSRSATRLKQLNPSEEPHTIHEFDGIACCAPAIRAFLKTALSRMSDRKMAARPRSRSCIQGGPRWLQVLSNGSTRRKATDSFNPRAAAETCLSISPRSNAPALVLSMRVRRSNMRLSAIAVRNPRTI